MTVDTKRAITVIGAMVITFLVLRVYLHTFPNQDLDVAGYNVHHLFTGLLLITLGGLPMAILRGNHRILDLAAVAFGVGLAMGLDEWVYLIVTDGSNASYILPVSFWGGLGFVGFACGYAGGMSLYLHRRTKGRRDR